jgi:hypothetical protein
VSTGGKRLLAIVVAIALIGIAVLIRGVIDDGGGDGGSSSPSGDGHTPTLLCAAELEQVCTSLQRDAEIDVQLEPSDVSANTLASIPDDQLRDLGIDGWLTTSRDAQIARDKRARASLGPAVGKPSAPIGRSPLVIGIWKDRAQALATRCGATITWHCIGDVAGRPWRDAGGDASWGVVKPAHASPETTREGLLVIGQAASDYFGRSDLSIDDYADDAFLEWFGQLEDNARIEGQSPFEQMLVGGAALYDIVGTTEAEAGPDLARAARDRRDRVELLYPAPVATADIVYAPIKGAPGADDLRDIVTGDGGRAALARAGWRVDGEDRAPGVPSSPRLPARDNLPDAGSLQALLETSREVTG